ncbi:hypothetical protein J437_LFUL013633 [Ladona fulva]|uniref:Uncharacterized protein n=1 Tax=Ladona fulva TaxID=123851 RepID=A0A8K0P769_LADFU|nr:hypothetical protein J437_LFUL013633 [Ladona fulva]
MYGKKSVSHNVQALIHLHHDVSFHGCLERISAFKFEDELQMLKRLVRKKDKSLQQIIRRQAEMGLKATRVSQCSELVKKNIGTLPMGLLEPEFLMAWKIVEFGLPVCSNGTSTLLAKPVSVVPQAWLFEGGGRRDYLSAREVLTHSSDVTDLEERIRVVKGKEFGRGKRSPKRKTFAEECSGAWQPKTLTSLSSLPILSSDEGNM